jgi:VWFA-related protein
VTVYPIAFHGNYGTGTNRYVSARAFLNALAEASGGHVHTPTGSRDLSTIYQKILDELASQYVLGFVSDNPKLDGKFRRLRVEVRGKELRVRHRIGYYGTANGRVKIRERN